MNSDIRLSISFKGHRKRIKLRRIIGDRSDSYLIDLWLTVALDRPDGVLTGWDEVDIAASCGWQDDPDIIVNAFIDSGWIDQDSNGCFCIHDWSTHQVWACNAQKRSMVARQNIEKRWNKKNSIIEKEEIQTEYERYTDGIQTEIRNGYSYPIPFLSFPIPKEEEQKKEPEKNNQNKSDIKERLRNYLSMEIENQNLSEFKNKIIEFFDYRMGKIKSKRYETEKGVSRLIKDVQIIIGNNLDVNKCLDYTMEKEWQTPDISYFEKVRKELAQKTVVIPIYMDGNKYAHSTYQAGGLWKTSKVQYLCMSDEWMKDCTPEELTEIQEATEKFISEFCVDGENG